VHKINALIISSVLLFILGCEDKNTSSNTIPIENTTEVLNQTTSSQSDTNRFKITKHNTSATAPVDYTNLSDTFQLSNIQNNSQCIKQRSYLSGKHKRDCASHFFCYMVSSLCP